MKGELLCQLVFVIVFFSDVENNSCGVGFVFCGLVIWCRISCFDGPYNTAVTNPDPDHGGVGKDLQGP